jgi:hypothetical protein
MSARHERWDGESSAYRMARKEVVVAPFVREGVEIDYTTLVTWKRQG